MKKINENNERTFIMYHQNKKYIFIQKYILLCSLLFSMQANANEVKVLFTKLTAKTLYSNPLSDKKIDGLYFQWDRAMCSSDLDFMPINPDTTEILINDGDSCTARFKLMDRLNRDYHLAMLGSIQHDTPNNISLNGEQTITFPPLKKINHNTYQIGIDKIKNHLPNQASTHFNISSAFLKGQVISTAHFWFKEKNGQYTKKGVAPSPSFSCKKNMSNHKIWPNNLREYDSHKCDLEFDETNISFDASRYQPKSNIPGYEIDYANHDVIQHCKKNTRINCLFDQNPNEFHSEIKSENWKTLISGQDGGTPNPITEIVTAVLLKKSNSKSNSNSNSVSSSETTQNSNQASFNHSAKRNNSSSNSSSDTQNYKYKFFGKGLFVTRSKLSVPTDGSPNVALDCREDKSSAFGICRMRNSNTMLLPENWEIDSSVEPFYEIRNIRGELLQTLRENENFIWKDSDVTVTYITTIKKSKNN